MKNKNISYGDRIFTRISFNGRTLYNFVTERASSITDIIMEVRRLLKEMKGLVTLHIRNYNEGWGEERPLMLYGLNKQPVIEQNSPRMLFPWETH